MFSGQSPQRAKMEGSTDDLVKAIAAFTSSCMMEAVRRRKQELGLRNHGERKYSSPSLPYACLLISPDSCSFLQHHWLCFPYCPDSPSFSQASKILKSGEIINPQGVRAPIQLSTQYSTKTVLLKIHSPHSCPFPSLLTPAPSPPI